MSFSSLFLRSKLARRFFSDQRGHLNALSFIKFAYDLCQRENPGHILRNVACRRMILANTWLHPAELQPEAGSRLCITMVILIYGNSSIEGYSSRADIHTRSNSSEARDRSWLHFRMGRTRRKHRHS